MFAGRPAFVIDILDTHACMYYALCKYLHAYMDDYIYVHIHRDIFEMNKIIML